MEGIVALFALLWLVGWVVGLIWVVADAGVNSSQSAILWGLVVFFGGILGVLLYALLGRDKKGQSSRDRGPNWPHEDQSYLASNEDQSSFGDGDGEQPSHVCQSCGEQYYLRSSAKVDTCQRCGGVRVEQT